MKTKSLLLILILALFLASMAAADDGQMFRRNISKTPAGETEEAALTMMGFYVPAQASDGTLLEGIDYYDAEGTLVDTRELVKPLISIYIDGMEEEPEGGGPLPFGGVSFGERDAFGALSLDDGASWKNTNVSRSAGLSSFVLANGHEYPGDVHYMTFAVAGDRILAAWLSKYCESGSPLYTYDDTAIAELRNAYPHLPDLYVDDLFGVAGAQGSVDYTLQGFPEVGEIPYSCVWSARGKLVLDEETNLYDVLWTKAERHTSGRRDANRVEVAAEPGAGFVMVWQEDPEGLRPGKGLGPGEGWSGAIVNNKTDMWYSYVGWHEFDQVVDPDGNVSTMDEYTNDLTPKVTVPFAMPVRLSDNNQCKATPKTDTTGELLDPYCYADFDIENQTYTMPDENGGVHPDADFCAEEVQWENPGGTILGLCQTTDGRLLWGRTGAARTRINLRGYDQDNDGIYDSAWVIMAYEELKALGDELVCDGDDICEPVDIGKNIWYHSFDMFHPDLVHQGLMLNQPAVDRDTGEFYDIYVDEWDNDLYLTEISRRFNIMTQAASKVDESGTVGILIYKQGIINQGGPADIYLRRVVLPDPFDPTTDNPYAYENIVCENRAYTDGSNPNYVYGLCLDPAVNVSGNNIVACDNGTSGDGCADLFPWDGGETYPKVVEWSQDVDNLDDQSWENPYDVAKGHRGFIDGDFIMMMYAWSPNWKSNTVGNDHYNLYVRRSFDGGLTWTTTPADLGGDGTSFYEYYGHGNEVTPTLLEFGPGEFEQARNVSELIGNKITVLDPRYTPSGGPRMFTAINTMADGTSVTPYDDDVRDPSRFFIIYETGDNTTVAEGEAVPLDLFYSRGYDYGDDYDYVEYYKDKDGDGTPELVEEWDWLENKADDLSGEASVSANPGATFFYAVWNQWREHLEDGHEVITDSDIWFRRVMYLDEEDGRPTATILYAPHAIGHNQGGAVTLVGTGKDNDHMGDAIVAYQWRSSIDGVLCNSRICTVPATDLSLGIHTLSFKVQDAEGNWSPEKTVGLFVAETLYQTYLPIIAR